MTDTHILQGKLAAYFTLGCKLNFAETSTIAQKLAEVGVRTVRKGERADICIVNTCSVTEVADHKCRQAIHKLVRQHPGAFVIVMGCYAQLKPEEVMGIEGVSLVLSQKSWNISRSFFQLPKVFIPEGTRRTRAPCSSLLVLAESARVIS